MDLGGQMFPCSVCNGARLIDSVKVPGEARRNRLELGASLLFAALAILASLNVHSLVGTVLFGIGAVVGAVALYRFLSA